MWKISIEFACYTETCVQKNKFANYIVFFRVHVLQFFSPLRETHGEEMGMHLKNFTNGICRTGHDTVWFNLIIIKGVGNVTYLTIIFTQVVSIEINKVPHVTLLLCHFGCNYRTYLWVYKFQIIDKLLWPSLSRTLQIMIILLIFHSSVTPKNIHQPHR